MESVFDASNFEDSTTGREEALKYRVDAGEIVDGGTERQREVKDGSGDGGRMEQRDEGGHKLSQAQASLVEHLRKGWKLEHEAQTSGRFKLSGAGGSRTVHPATVNSLIEAGYMFKDVLGRVRLTDAS